MNFHVLKLHWIYFLAWAESCGTRKTEDYMRELNKQNTIVYWNKEAKFVTPIQLGI